MPDDESTPEESPYEDHHDALQKAYERGRADMKKELGNQIAAASEEGYVLGRAHMKKEILGGDSDGWCAWHPRHGFNAPLRRSEYKTALREAKRCIGAPYFTKEQIEDAEKDPAMWGRLMNAGWELAEKDGWKIVPVKIVAMEEK